MYTAPRERASRVGLRAIRGNRKRRRSAIAICGLTGIYAPIMAAVATIVLGVALAGDGNRLLRNYKQARSGGDSLRNGPLRFSVLVAGLVGGALGLFALLDADPAFLTPVASVVFGAGLVLRSNIAWQLRLLETDDDQPNRNLLNQTTETDATVFGLSGFVSGALGAIAAAGNVNDLTLNLIAILVLASTLVIWSKVTMVVATKSILPISLILKRAS
jgi:hypothetical protein